MLSDTGSPHVADAQPPRTKHEFGDPENRSEGEQSPPLKRKAPSPSHILEEEATSKRPKVNENGISRNGAGAIDDEERSNGTVKKEEGRHSKRDLPPRSESSNERAREEPRRPSEFGPDRPKGLSQEERKRGQRLFGGLLSTLSQTTTNTQQKKRLEIERRQQERAHQQRIEDDKRRADRLSKLNEVREIEQVKFDERVMNTRHSNMLAKARSLQTRSAPKLYYLPWELTDDQEREIKEQTKVAEDAIEKETDEFKRQKEQRLRDLGVSHQPTLVDSTVGAPKGEDSNPTTVESTNRAPAKYLHEKDHDEKDVMVETEEDTVIY